MGRGGLGEEEGGDEEEFGGGEGEVSRVRGVFGSFLGVLFRGGGLGHRLMCHSCCP